MKKEIKYLGLIGIILITIGVIFCIKTKNINFKILVRNNSITYQTSKVYTIKNNAKGKVNIEIDTNEEGFYKIEFPTSINFYYDNELTKKIDNIYKIYEKATIDNFTVYYKNEGKDYSGSIKIEVQKSAIDGTMVNRAKSKEYFWSDEYRPYIENIEFVIKDNFECQDLCFDISDKLNKVYANLIKVENKYNLQIISDNTIYFPKDSSYLFSDFTNLKNINFNNTSTKYVQDMSYMFANNNSIENIDLSKFDTQNVMTMESMFSNSINLKQIDLSSFVFNSALLYNDIFRNIDNNATVYVKSSIEQAWVLSVDKTSRPENWKTKNVVVK